MDNKGNLFIISAPSGTGKTTLCRIIMEDFTDIGYSVSHTTRSPRDGEKEGVDYYFVSKTTFLKMVDEDRLAEWAEVHGNYYGTSVDYLNKCIVDGKDILLDIDVNGARQIVEKYPDAVSVFIMPPSMEELRKRLTGRGTDSAEVIEKRIKNAEGEIAEKEFYRHILINDDLDTAAAELRDIFDTYRTHK